VRTPTKLAAYAALLALVVGVGAGLGAAGGPIDVSGDDDHGDGRTRASPGEHAAGVAAEPAGATAPGGVVVAQGGYRLDVPTTTGTAGRPWTLSFRVLDDAGRPVTRFAVEHEKRLHLVVVGRNLVDYAHVHPTMAADGLWTVELPALPAGSYRAFADFRPAGGEALTLGVDLMSTGSPPATGLPAPAREAQVDGYDVSLHGEARRGESELGFAVRLGGEPVRTEPYLGAAGHLVAIREGDLAYLHVHPVEGDGDEVRFVAELPTAGTYRLFLDFSHGGRVRTAAFTVEVPDTPATDSTPASEHGDDQ
jgi:hypothetical protein